MVSSVDKGARRRYWVIALWVAYVVFPIWTGLLFASEWECTPIGSLRLFLASLGYITIGVAIYVLTGASPADEAGRVRRGTAALAALSAVFALQAAVHAYGCPY